MLYQDSLFMFRFAEERIIPRIHLEGIPGWSAGASLAALGAPDVFSFDGGFALP
jgi:hypothetical protein